MGGVRYTTNELAQAKRFKDAGLTVSEIAKKLGRSWGSIHKQLRLLDDKLATSPTPESYQDDFVQMSRTTEVQFPKAPMVATETTESARHRIEIIQLIANSQLPTEKKLRIIGIL